MIRRIIQIDTNKCNGCGACVSACHEGAIKLIDNKAVLVRDDYCDGLGDCLPVCPCDAISFIEREALEYNEAEVIKAKTLKKLQLNKNTISGSNLTNFPIQIKLVPTNALSLNNCNLLIAADCTAYSYANFHEKFIKGHTTLIACPKLDGTDYSIKLASIFENNNINSITIVNMNVPCCKGIKMMVYKALEKTNKNIKVFEYTITTRGDLIK